MALSAWRMPLVAVVALLLLWRILSVNPVLEGGRPGMPALTGHLDEATFAAGDATAALRDILRRDPAEFGALMLLAQSREQSGKIDEAGRMYRLAVSLAPQDPAVLSATAGHLLRHGEVLEGLQLMSRLAEHHPSQRATAFAVFTRLLASGERDETWRALLVNDPAWVGPFIVEVCARDVDALRLVPLLLDRVRAGHRDSREIGCVIDRLRNQDHWTEAYQVWLNILPRERLADVGFVFNGGFEEAPVRVGFDWMLADRPERESGHTADLVPTLGAVGVRALRIDYNGRRQNGVPAAQFTALPPGRYRLSGMARSEGLKVGRGARWTLRCVHGGAPQQPIAASERFAGPSEWHRFEMPATVPEDCAGQILQLEPADAQYGPVFLAGRLWFDDIAMQRLPEGRN